MSVGLTVGAGLAIAGGIGAAGSIASGLIGSSAATSAAQTQASAAEQATAIQQQEWQTEQNNAAPWLAAGNQSLSQILAGLQPGGQFTTPNAAGTFTAPTLAQAEQTPGYQFTQQQGDLGIEQGAAAAGGAFNSGTLKSLSQYNQGLASTYYQQAYNNALNTYQTQFNANNTNTTNLYNRLAGVANTGQQTAIQLGQLGNQAASTIGNTVTGGAAATAGGIVGSANAITGGLSGATNNITGQLTLAQLLNQANYGSGSSTVPGVAGSTASNPLNVQATPYVPPTTYGDLGVEL